MPDDMECWPSFSPSSYSAGGRLCFTTTSDEGLRAFAGRDEQRLKDMVTLANRKLGDLSALPKDPAATFALLDRFVRTNIMATEDDRQSLALDHGPGVVCLSGRRARPPEHAGVVTAGDDAELGDESACEAAEHGVRDDR